MMHWLILIIGVLAGALFGSFLNVVTWRGPAMWGLAGEDTAPRGNLFAPRSYCPACHSPIRIRDNIPLLSFLILRGRCADCNVVIPLRYFLVEILGAGAVLAAIMMFGASLSAALASVFLLTLIALAAIDWETGFLPDMLTLPLITIGFAANAAGLFIPLKDAVIGAAVGYLVLWSIAAFYKSLRGHEGLGLGDAKLLAALGAWSGWVALPVTVMFAAMVALLAVGIVYLRGGDIRAETAIPFGPALTVAGAVVFLLHAAMPVNEHAYWLLF
jgi:leader peptidase (prepilin peptidase) / N-methyltransferase